MRIIDTHCHLIHRDRLHYPWLREVPALDRDFTLDDYLPEATAAGITDILHVEVDVAPADLAAEADFISGLGPRVIGTIAGCRPESPDFPQYLERISANPRVKELRRVLHTQPDGLAQSPLFAANIARLQGSSLTFDLCVLARQIPIATALAAHCPGVQFILDHCGNPDVRNREWEPWATHLGAIAALPNVTCKLSGVVTNADPATWTTGDLRPFVEHVIGCFGRDRVMWGSDWPVCTLAADLGRWMAATHVLLSGLGDDERAGLLCKNAQRIYRLA